MKKSLIRRIPRKAWSFLNVINRLVPKDKNRIFLYSNLGFRDNIKAVFDYLIENGYNNRYKIIVSLNNWENFAETAEENVEYINNTKGLFKFFRSKYCYYCFGKYPVKPAKGQMVFNLWHGMPLKRVGNMVRGQEKVDYNYFTHLLCTSEYFRDIMKQSFNASDDQIFICGQPRTDEMLDDIPIEYEMAAKTALMSYEDRIAKMMLWLPTYREGAESELDILNITDLEKLDRLMDENGWCMIVKLHPLSKFRRNPGRYRHINFIDDKTLQKEHIGFYSLIGMSDCLITDYSSVYFDYLLLDRPMAFAVSDIYGYTRDRGFTVSDPTTIMPGDMIKNSSDFLAFAEKMMKGKDDFSAWRKRLNKQFNRYADNRNCSRVTGMIPRSASERAVPYMQYIEKNK